VEVRDKISNRVGMIWVYGDPTLSQGEEVAYDFITMPGLDKTREQVVIIGVIDKYETSITFEVNRFPDADVGGDTCRNLFSVTFDYYVDPRLASKVVHDSLKSYMQKIYEDYLGVDEVFIEELWEMK
jgi:hypothetical protein